MSIFVKVAEVSNLLRFTSIEAPWTSHTASVPPKTPQNILRSYSSHQNLHCNIDFSISKMCYSYPDKPWKSNVVHLCQDVQTNMALMILQDHAWNRWLKIFSGKYGLDWHSWYSKEYLFLSICEGLFKTKSWHLPIIYSIVVFWIDWKIPLIY